VGGDVAIAERRRIEKLETALQRRGCETLQKSLFNSFVSIDGLCCDDAGDVAYSRDHVGRQCTDDVQVA
jgi:hypothetical protein